MLKTSIKSGRRLRVLHIATWYPSSGSPYRVPFIKGHYEALEAFCQQRLIHVEVSADDRFDVEYEFGRNDQSRVVIRGYRGPTRLREILTLLLLFIVRVRLGVRRNWDVVVVHVAWPTLRFPRIFRLLFGRRIVLFEHWSAYSRDFYLDPRSRAHARMRQMFSVDVPVVAVSKSLGNDISRFAQRDDLDIRIVPNVVGDRFGFDGFEPGPSIFMAANWNSFRLPFLVLRCMPKLLVEHPNLRLVIAGAGPKLEEMKGFVGNHEWRDQVLFLGQIGRDEIARHLRKATIFAHPALHETFSVITAEAMCCGVPVVVSDVGALPELVTPGISGFLVENDEASWCRSLLRALDPEKVWDRDLISSSIKALVAPDVVGKKLSDVLVEVVSR